MLEDFKRFAANFAFGVRYAYLGQNRGLAHTRSGRPIFVDTSDAGVSIPMISGGTWEPHVARVLKRLLRSGSRMVEVGSNIGVHTIAAAARVGPGGRVFAFEAHPRTFSLLTSTVLANGFSDRVLLHQAAAADTDGSLPFSAETTYASGAHLVRAGIRPGGAEVLEVPAIRLDTALADQFGKIDVLRMDTEGAEPLILRGARNLIASCPNLKILTEWAPPMMEAFADVRTHLDELEGAGFRARQVTPLGRLAPISREELLSATLCEVLFERSSRRDL